MKEKKMTSIVNALKSLNCFSKIEIDEFNLILKQPDKKNKLLRELRIPIKKGLLIKKLSVNRIDFDKNKILDCNDYNILLQLEIKISLEMKKSDLIKKINDKKIPISKDIIKKIILSNSIAKLNTLIQELPANIKFELKTINFRDSEHGFVSINPIYTPMGNKR
ncbi:hypothetical protein EZ449_13365 [Pedobacter frigidisoli]|uniref:Uncharacterized protein n=1 Tax=Pedobacter frigidisoli TaxID=2530455 RepID=A0A4R0P3N7_9SPHI|nr:hypothetical protein [Pedobacter frigidisoli]TCD08384.1 hypothetical protein EZ449_13365 [Pedobacter frigidisoli]